MTDAEPPKAPENVFTLGAGAGHLLRDADDGGATWWCRSSSHCEFGYAQVRARGHTELLREIEDHVTADGLVCWMCGCRMAIKSP